MRRLLLLLPLLGGACADDSFAVLRVLTSSGTLDGISQLRVFVSNASDEKVLLYPRQASQPLHLDNERPVTLSVQFGASSSGETTFEIEALSPDMVLGYGEASIVIEEDSVSNLTVRIFPGTVRPERRLDAGASIDGQAQLACDPVVPSAACGAGQTCGIVCALEQPASAMCYLAGAKQPGELCTSNRDCAPGSQCLTFTATGCSVMTCLKFCGDDQACGEPDSYCNVPIRCGSTGRFSACSRPCDPTLGSGCVPGLSCFVYDGETTDCGCPGQGGVGAGCTQNSGCNGQSGCAGCSAGLSCVIPPGADAGAGTGTCRPVCKIAAPACPSGTSCHPFDNSSRRLYGFCQ